MNFIKKNYEKILLGAVLLGLLGAVLMLPVVIAADKAALNATVRVITHPQPKPLAPLDMTDESSVLARVESPYALDLETTNRLFNPLRWQEKPDGTRFPILTGNEVGPGAVKITSTKPLYFNLKLDSIEPANSFSPARYVISMQRENAPIPGQRMPHDTYISVGEKNNIFSLVSANGPLDNPNLVLQMIDSGETATLSKDKPFQRIDGYMADLMYPPQNNKKWSSVRVGDVLKNINGDNYIVVVIDTNEVVLSAESNQKKTTVKYQP